MRNSPNFWVIITLICFAVFPFPNSYGINVKLKRGPQPRQLNRILNSKKNIIANLGSRLKIFTSIKGKNEEEGDQVLFQEELKQTSKSKAADKDKSKDKVKGGDPWWLKDLPWWLPPPPEWGPLPPTMYAAYYHKTNSAPLSTPNYYPLFRRVEDLEPPLGHYSPLESNGPSDVNPEGGTHPLKANENPTFIQIASTDTNNLNKKLDEGEAETMLLQTGAQEKQIDYKGIDPDPKKADGGPESFGYAGPRNILSEHLINFDVQQVTKKNRYYSEKKDKSMWKLAPEYPPSLKIIGERMNR